MTEERAKRVERLKKQLLEIIGGQRSPKLFVRHGNNSGEFRIEIARYLSHNDVAVLLVNCEEVLWENIYQIKEHQSIRLPSAFGIGW